MLIPVTSPRVAFEYLRQALRDGWALAHASLALPLESGRLSTHLPGDNAQEVVSRWASAEEWRWGGRLRGAAAAWDAAADIASDYLEANPAHCLVIEDFVAAPTDPVLARQGHPPFVVLDGHVYVVLSPMFPRTYTAYRHRMRAVFSDALSFRLVAWLIDAPFGAEPVDEGARGVGAFGPQDSRALIERIVTQTQSLIVSAFDTESFLLWRRRRRRTSLRLRLRLSPDGLPVTPCR